MESQLDKIGLCSLADPLTKSTYYLEVNGFGVFLKKILLSVAELFIKHREALLSEEDLSQIPGPHHP